MKISKRIKNCSTAVVLILLSIAGYLYCKANTLAYEGEIGSMYMPKLLFVCLLVLSVLKLIYSLKDDPTPIEVKIDKKKMLIGMGTIILVGLYCVLFKTLGFVIVTFLYLVGQMALFCPGRKRWGLVVLIALLATAATYLIFAVAFSLMLPLGPLKNILIW